MPSYARPRFPHSRRASPTALAVIVAVHGVALVAVARAKLDLPAVTRSVTEVINVPLPAPPPEIVPTPPTRPAPTTPAPRPRATEPMVSLPMFPPVEAGPVIDLIPPPVPVPLLPPGPVAQEDAPVVAAKLMTAGDRLRPAYPADKLRAGEEATLKLRLTIDRAGRVVAVEPVGPADPSFLAAARAHILKVWRYQPATRDRAAMATTQIVRLTFALDDA